MKLSKRGEYALRALIDMGIARDLGRPLVQIGDLAQKEALPIKFLEQILMQLKEAGYIESKRGKLGGYFLSMPAKKIKVGQVIRLIDGPLAPVACVSHTAYERCSCPDEEHCGLRMLMNDVRNAIANILDRFTLEDTVSMTLRKIRRNKAEIPFIEGLLSRPLTAVAQPVPKSPVRGKENGFNGSRVSKAPALKEGVVSKIAKPQRLERSKATARTPALQAKAVTRPKTAPKALLKPKGRSKKT